MTIKPALSSEIIAGVAKAISNGIIERSPSRQQADGDCPRMVTTRPVWGVRGRGPGWRHIGIGQPLIPPICVLDIIMTDGRGWLRQTIRMTCRVAITPGLYYSDRTRILCCDYQRLAIPRLAAMTKASATYSDDPAHATYV